jgi:signal transduction histidine kinase
MHLNIQEHCSLRRVVYQAESLVDILKKWIEHIEKGNHQKIAVEKNIVDLRLKEQESLQHFMVHQMKSPILKARNHLQQVQGITKGFLAKRDWAQGIEEGSKVLEKTSDSINQYLHILQQKESFRVQPISLKQVWESLEKMYQDLYHLNVSLPSLSKKIERPLIQGGLAQCFMIFESLIENAKVATQGQGWIRIKEKPHDEYYEVLIQDSGPGISIDRVSKIFEPFYSSRAEGHGLGLFFCRQLLEKMGGHIQYIYSDSKEQRGFYIRFAYAHHSNQK